ncbi:hypothetical protein FIBSPDRAFT_929690 [Athelia psychrophila]|uniref:Uncharacterized protein n=1 Tax=Athelia psychrophila TaxID=1759441 RepID=A0A166NAZ9_9AGAM|nr:hypothetical protein FIBSPDRAFT_929690 [Fibularhizoctonia sp. CBS 109695]
MRLRNCIRGYLFSTVLPSGRIPHFKTLGIEENVFCVIELPGGEDRHREMKSQQEAMGTPSAYYLSGAQWPELAIRSQAEAPPTVIISSCSVSTVLFHDSEWQLSESTILRNWSLSADVDDSHENDRSTISATTSADDEASRVPFSNCDSDEWATTNTLMNAYGETSVTYGNSGITYEGYDGGNVELDISVGGPRLACAAAQSTTRKPSSFPSDPTAEAIPNGKIDQLVVGWHPSNRLAQRLPSTSSNLENDTQPHSPRPPAHQVLSENDTNETCCALFSTSEETVSCGDGDGGSDKSTGSEEIVSPSIQRKEIKAAQSAQVRQALPVHQSPSQS